MDTVQVCDSLWGVTVPAPVLGQEPIPVLLTARLVIHSAWIGGRNPGGWGGGKGEGSPGRLGGEGSPRGGKSREEDAQLGGCCKAGLYEGSSRHVA